MLRKIWWFCVWKYYDYRHKPKKRPYGIYCYVGLPGQGKTLSMVEKLYQLKKEFPQAKIYTNFGFRFQHGHIDDWHQLVELQNGEDGIIFAIDEIQNTFSSRKWKNFPMEMLSLITQNRKQAKQFLCTAQSFDMIDINFRRICNYIVECRNLSNRWIFQRAFLPDEYKVKDGVYTPRRRAWRYSFIADNKIYYSYDTYKIIESMMSGENATR